MEYRPWDETYSIIPDIWNKRKLILQARGENMAITKEEQERREKANTASGLLFNPDKNKSTLRKVPRFEDPVGECCGKVKCNHGPDIGIRNDRVGVTTGEGHTVGSIKFHGDGKSAGVVEDKIVSDDKMLRRSLGIPEDGHDAFDIRLCKVCGCMSDAGHRSLCVADKPAVAQSDNKDIHVSIRRITNGFIVSADLSGDTYFSTTRQVLSYIRDRIERTR